MNATEAGQLLAFAALYDNRKVSDPDVMAWLKAIGDLPYADCEQAIAGHYGTCTERVMPGHVRERVKTIRADRLARNPLPAPAAEVADDPGRYREIIRANVQRIADGMDIRTALPSGEPLPGDPPEEWQQAREAIAEVKPIRPDPRDVAREQAEQSRKLRGEDAS
jgi:hypothetical protein